MGAQPTRAAWLLLAFVTGTMEKLYLYIKYLLRFIYLLRFKKPQRADSPGRFVMAAASFLKPTRKVGRSRSVGQGARWRPAGVCVPTLGFRV